MVPIHPSKRNPPRPPTLDVERAAAAVQSVAKLIGDGLDYMALTGPDRWTDAGCNLIAFALMDIVRGYRIKSIEKIESATRWMRDYLPELPDKLAACRDPLSISIRGEWVGWIKVQGRGEKWRSVVAGRTESETFTKLCEYKSKPAHCSLVVLRNGENP